MVVADIETVYQAVESDRPKILGAYRLGPVIGSGAFGFVHLAIDTADRSTWAIKIVPRRSAQNPRPEDDLAAQRLAEEVRIAERLHHPNVISLRESFQTAECSCLVSTFAPGGDLMRKLKAVGRLPEDIAQGYFRQLMSGVQCLHSRGVVHRDLKPENLLLDESDCLKIADFGLAATFSPSDTTAPVLLRECCGTLHYAAPEVLQRKRYDGRAADIWSCGVILYVMLTGNFPFDARNKDQLIAKVCKGEYARARSASPFAQALLDGLLVLDPAKRLTAETALSCAWLSSDCSRAVPRERSREVDRSLIARSATPNCRGEVLSKPPAPRPRTPVNHSSKTVSGPAAQQRSASPAPVLCAPTLPKRLSPQASLLLSSLAGRKIK